MDEVTAKFLSWLAWLAFILALVVYGILSVEEGIGLAIGRFALSSLMVQLMALKLKLM